MKAKNIRQMKREDALRVLEIFGEGMQGGAATLETSVPEYGAWDRAHLPDCRFVCEDETGRILGWAALSPVSAAASVAWAFGSGSAGTGKAAGGTCS